MSRWIGLAFLAAGAVNIIGMLVISRGFTNDVLAISAPHAFSTFGQAMIVVWGMAYISVARSWKDVPWLCFVFFIEKMFYVSAWLIWWGNSADQFSSILEQDRMTAIFIAVYGANDLAFGLLFLCAFVFAKRSSASPQ
ncbi:hypothetical protein [Marinobacter sp. LQ44]|uniref:hypothetical protein n=1 Tax=unclassified Marinobacter TaxID=83889 RepID=UPI000718E260|nr:hypothetical protein [Marinobacter sp. LQ44]AMQ90062.1 hypothetical protein ASQ50_15945 [Marinobacter sp. LQ44]